MGNTQVCVFLAHETFFPGNVVEGYVRIDAAKPFEFAAIRAKIVAKERTHITAGSKKHRTHYTQSTVLHKQLVTLAGQAKCLGSHGAVQSLPEGRYTYPFAFQLPVFIPPSFQEPQNPSARIVHYVKAYVDGPNGRDAAHKRWFRVLSALPQRQWIAREPVQVDRNWNITMCCCVNKGKVSGCIFMDRTVIAIDRDNVVICADLDNSLGQEPIESLEVSLLHHVEYTAKGHQRRQTAVVGHVPFLKQVVAAGQRGRVAGAVPIPRECWPSVLGHTIKSTYTVKIELNIPWATDPEHEFPVTLAHCVDETDYLPEVNYCAVESAYPIIPKGAPGIETYYTAPPMPVFDYRPVPLSSSSAAPQPFDESGNSEAMRLRYEAAPLFAVTPVGAWAPLGGAGSEGAPKEEETCWRQGMPSRPMPHRQPPSPPPQFDAYGGNDSKSPAAPSWNGGTQQPFVE